MIKPTLSPITLNIIDNQKDKVVDILEQHLNQINNRNKCKNINTENCNNNIKNNAFINMLKVISRNNKNVKTMINNNNVDGCNNISFNQYANNAIHLKHNNNESFNNVKEEDIKVNNKMKKGNINIHIYGISNFLWNHMYFCRKLIYEKL